MFRMTWGEGFKFLMANALRLPGPICQSRSPTRYPGNLQPQTLQCAWSKGPIHAWNEACLLAGQLLSWVSMRPRSCSQGSLEKAKKTRT